jgi:hypothetical protein
MSLVPERWGLVGTGYDEDGLPMVLVAREKTDYTDRWTIWRLVQRPNGWYNTGQYISSNLFRRTPEPKGVKLSDSRIDNILRDFATQGESALA